MAKTSERARPVNAAKSLRALVRYMGRAKTLLLAVGVLAAVCALAQLLGTYMIKPVVNSISQGDTTSFYRGIVLTATIYGVGALCALGYTQIMVRAAQRVTSELRRDLFAHLQKLPLSYFDNQQVGNVMSLFTNDIDTVAEALNNSFANIIQAAIQAAGTMVVLFVLDWRLSCITLLCDVVLIGYVRRASAKGSRLFACAQETLASLDGYVQEMLAGERVVQQFCHEQASIQGFCCLNENLRATSTTAQTYAATTTPIAVAMTYTNYAIVAVAGALLAAAGHADMGSLASYLVFVRQAAMPFNQVTQLGNFLLSALAGAERIFALIDMAPELDEGSITLGRVPQNLIQALDEAPSKGAAPHVPSASERASSQLVWRTADGVDIPCLGDVRLEDVSFSYRAHKPVLTNLSLFAKPGQKIALVGSTGAGKTTITNLINRFYEIEAGAILIDGIDIRSIEKASLRSCLAMVLQDTHLFAGTLADNIRFGKLDASDEEVRAAATCAHADGFIRRLPQGYETKLDADGSNLSGGQRQLIAIARAAIANPTILILDEATSSVDTRTEALIERGMDALMEGRTTFVIAHRLSTVRNADAILVIEHGCIVERGSHDELMALHGEYWKLASGMKEMS